MIFAKDSELLENLLVKYGQVVTTAQIFATAKASFNRKQTQYLITTLTKQGWLIRVKRGLYAIADLSSRGFLTLSVYQVANLLAVDSYVSFASALNYHGMFDQLVANVGSVALKSHKKTRLQNTTYSFVKTKARYYFGWQEARVENKIVRIATAEKALVDMMQFHRTRLAVDLVIEKLREHKKDIDLIRLNDFAAKMSVTTIKVFGFVFDLLGIDSAMLLKLARRSGGAHKMTASAKIFNAKWRLYYDAHFDTYKI